MSQATYICTDFILDTLRTIRPNPANLPEGTRSGTALWRLWNVTAEAYSETDFRDGLNQLIQNGTILVAAKITRYNDETGRKLSRAHLIPSIPAAMPVARNSWLRNLGAETGAPGEYEEVNRVLVYIAQDGVPVRVSKLTNKTLGANAAQILAQMQKAS